MNNQRRVLLVGLAHPDDEVGCAGTIAAHVARGDRVVLVWLTRGSMTEALGALTAEEVARQREEHARTVAGLLGCEPRFLDFEDLWVEATPATAHRVAPVIAELQPDALITWGDAWRRGPRHPDHQATGKIFRDAITIARMARAVAPVPAHRKPCPVFTIREPHSTLPQVAIDVAPFMEQVRAVGAFYYERVGWPRADWLEQRLARMGNPFGVPAAEAFDAWDTAGGLFSTLV